MKKIIHEDTKKNKNNNNFILILKKHRRKIIVLLLLSIIIYICFVVIKLAIKPTDTVYVEMGQIQEEEDAEGYIIRDEVVIKGQNYKNGMEQIKTEGEKVAKGETIFRYFSKNEKNLLEKIANLDLKIDEAMSKEKPFSADAKVLEDQIEQKINQLSGVSNLKIIQSNKQDINNNMTKKAKITGDLSPSGSYLKKLIDERKEYENQLNEGAEKLTASRSGVVSYRVDGYEEIFSTKDFGKYNKDFFENLNLKTGQIIPTSTESGKIIDNYTCYIISILDSKYANDAQVGDTVKLKLPNGKEVNASIEYKTIQDNENIITFKIDKEVEELISYRKISFNIIWWSESGMKIPNQAIKKEEKDGQELKYVTRTRIGYEDKILVKVLKSNEKYSIVTNYTSEELMEQGYTSTEIWSLPKITIYDEILIN